MAIGSTALANFIIVLIIGIVVGLAFNRYARGWLARLGRHAATTSRAPWSVSPERSSASTSELLLGCCPRR